MLLRQPGPGLGAAGGCCGGGAAPRPPESRPFACFADAGGAEGVGEVLASPAESPGSREAVEGTVGEFSVTGVDGKGSTEPALARYERH